MARGKCQEVAPDLFFPSDGMGVLVAQKICAECPVSKACLEYALENHIDHGVWGGCSERERRRILRRRRILAGRHRSAEPNRRPERPVPPRTPADWGRDPRMCGQRQRGPRRGRPGRAGRRGRSRSCSTCTRTPTTIDRSSPWPDRRTTVDQAVRRRWRRRSVARLDLGAQPGRTRVWACSMWFPSSPTTPASPDATTSAPPWSHRDDFARWLSATFDVPSFLYGPLARRPEPYIAPGQTACLRRLAARLRPRPAPPHRRCHRGRGPAGPGGLQRVGLLGRRWPGGWRPSCAARPCAPSAGRRRSGPGLVQPGGPGRSSARPSSTTRCADLVEEAGGPWTGAELVGLLPEAVLEAIPRHALGRTRALGAEKTVEARLTS